MKDTQDSWTNKENLLILREKCFHFLLFHIFDKKHTKKYLFHRLHSMYSQRDVARNGRLLVNCVLKLISTL